jgi:hypothetical protein
MAQMLHQKDSSAKHLRFGRRHIRLCGQISGAGQFAAAIQPKLDSLAAKVRERTAATEQRENAYDEVVFQDTQLDNAVRTVFERVKQYDREHTTRTLDLLFPGRVYSDLVRMPLSEEPHAVNKIIVKIEGMNAGAEFQELADLLKQKTEVSIAAWNAYQQTVVDYNAIAAAEEVVKLEVRQQYEYNWLDARRAYGANVANSLFPKVTSKTATHDKEEDDDDDEQPAGE